MCNHVGFPRLLREPVVSTTSFSALKFRVVYPGFSGVGSLRCFPPKPTNPRACQFYDTPSQPSLFLVEGSWSIVHAASRPSLDGL